MENCKVIQSSKTMWKMLIRTQIHKTCALERILKPRWRKACKDSCETPGLETGFHFPLVTSLFIVFTWMQTSHSGVFDQFSSLGKAGSAHLQCHGTEGNDTITQRKLSFFVFCSGNGFFQCYGCQLADTTFPKCSWVKIHVQCTSLLTMLKSFKTWLRFYKWVCLHRRLQETVSVHC